MNGEFVIPLLEWYRRNKRVLPWRDRHNAYYTWVSEIMLQQTRVEAVKPYFTRFITALPDVAALAACPEEKLLKLWEGLGYYSRVRNMQKAAVQTMERYGGMLPADYQELLSLKGIGRYTAGAIASIAYGIAVPAVDGNVLRVIARMTENDGDVMKQSLRRSVEEELLEILPKECPGDFNQALMELGAIVCVPNGPARCGDCPAAHWCGGCIHGTWERFPVKTGAKARKSVPLTVFVIQDGELTAIRKRPQKGLLAGLYELPNAPGSLNEREAVRYVEELGLEPLYIERLPEAKHIFSHVEWRMSGYLVRVSSLENHTPPELLFTGRKEKDKNYAIPSAFGAYVKYMREENS